MRSNEVVQAQWKCLRAAHRADMPTLTVVRARAFLKEYPQSGPAWKILGSALADLARHGEAEDALKQALAHCPPEKQWIPLSEMGHLYQARGDYAAAILWYRRAIDAVPDEAAGYIYLGGVLAKSGRLREAEAAHRAATRCTHGRRDEAFLNLGLVLRAQDRYQEAATCFEQALELDPKCSDARRALRDVKSTIRFLETDRATSRSIGCKGTGCRVGKRASLLRAAG